MNLAIAQYDIAWEAPAINRSKISTLLRDTETSIDLLILPEMFTTGFSMNVTEISETMDGPSIQWMLEMAATYKAVIAASLIIKEGQSYYNRLIWARPDGSFEHYDKRHLFTLAREDKYFAAGSKKLILDLEVDGVSWRICPLICYDLRFPVWSRNTDSYDLLIYVANFPAKRKFAWSQLLVARAIENQCYVAGVNRIGLDGVNIPYSGDSVILNYEGHGIESVHSNEGIFSAHLSKEKLRAFRRAYSFLRDRDDFEVLI